MDWLTFVSKLVEVLAWPVTLMLVLWRIWGDIPALVRALRRVKVGEVEFEFGEAARAVAKETTEALPTPAPAEAGAIERHKSDVAKSIESVAEFSPRTAILEAWLQVEASATDAIRARGVNITSKVGSLKLLDLLGEFGVLGSDQLKIFETLRALRNQAVHVPDAQFSAQSVADYIKSALRLAEYLDSMSAKESGQRT